MPDEYGFPTRGELYTALGNPFGGEVKTTVRHEADVPPNTVNATFGEKIVAKALGQYVPIVIGTGRVNGIFVLGGTTIITKTEYTVIENVTTESETYQPPPRIQQQADPLFGQPLIIVQDLPTTFTDTTINEEVVAEETVQTVVMVGYVLAFDALKLGYHLVHLEVNGQVLFDAENAIGTSKAYRFYSGRQTQSDPIADSMIGAAYSGAYQNYCMIFLEGYDADSPPSIVAVISNSVTDLPPQAEIAWTGRAPRFSPIEEAPHGALTGIHGANTCYDPARRLIYDLFNPYCHADLNLTYFWLAVCDVDSRKERYRIALEDTTPILPAVWNSWTLAMRGTQYVLIQLARTDVGRVETVVFDTLTGKRFTTMREEHYFAGTVRWFNGALFGGGRYYLVAGQALVEERAAYLLIDLTNGTFTAGFCPCPVRDPIVTMGRSTGSSVSFFMSGFDFGVSLPGWYRVYEMTFNGSWSSRKVYEEYGTFMNVLWYDPGTKQLITGMDYTNIRYINVSTGEVNATPFTGAAANYTIYQNYITDWQSAGKERFWPRPGYVLLSDLSNTTGGFPNGPVKLLHVKEQILNVFAPQPTEVGAEYFSNNIFDQQAGYYIDATYNPEWIIHYIADGIPVPMPLSECITKIMSLAGFVAGDLRFVGFGGVQTYGLTIASDTTYQSVLNQLQEVYSFTYCDTGNGFYFKKAGSGTGLVIDVIFDDSNICDREPPVSSTDQSDFATPIMTWFEYVSKESGYKSRPASFVMPADVSESIRRIRFSAPIVMTDADAQKFVTEKHFYLQENRRSHELTGRPSLLNALPGDIASIPSQDITFIAQIESMGVDLRNMSVEIVARDYQPSVETLITAVSNHGGQYLAVKYATQYFHLDVPLLNYAHDLGGEALVQYGFLAGQGQDWWPGGYVQRGPLPASLLGIWDQAPHRRVSGFATNLLPTMPNGHAGDFTNSLEVLVTNGYVPDLADASESQVMTGTNVVFYGQEGRWELMGCMNFTDHGDGTITLRNFPYRGALGTEVYDNHVVGDTVLIVPSSVEVRRAPHPVTDLDDTLYYKPIGKGQDPKFAPIGSHVITGAAETPYAPVNITGAIVGSDIVIDWDYRSRLSAWEFFSPSSPLPDSGEETTEFEVDIYDGMVVTRTITDIPINQVTYTFAQIIEDFGSIPPSLTVKVYMISAVVGRGHAGTATIIF